MKVGFGGFVCSNDMPRCPAGQDYVWNHNKKENIVGIKQ